jgi:hypothetical protein
LICSLPIIFSLLRSIPFIYSVLPPKAWPKIWWPKQLPNNLMSGWWSITFLIKFETTGTKRFVGSWTARALPGKTKTLRVLRSSSEGTSF